MTEFLIPAIENLLSIDVALILFAGTLAGLVVGALPGLSSTMGVALAIPMTFGMDPKLGLILLGAVYSSSVYGGSITAILLRTPGTDASIVTTLDGFPMTKKGLAGKAIGISTTASMIGGVTSTVALLLVAPPLARLALCFGPPEYFLVAVFGLSVIIGVSSENYLKGLIIGVLGLLIATAGLDNFTGVPRFVFKSNSMLDGIPVLPALIGLFSLSQAIKLAVGAGTTLVKGDVTFSDRVLPTCDDMGKTWWVMLRSCIIGIAIGIMPGAGTSIASFLAYNEARRVSKEPETFGKGNIQGVAAAEAANNAVVGGSLVPALTLGIPGNAVSAVFIGGLTIHGLIPGPSLFSKYGEITYTLILSLFIANILFWVIGIAFAKYFVKIIKTPTRILAPIICVLSVIGSYAIRGNFFDVGLLFAFGLLGYLMERFGFSPAPIVLSLILGPMAESELRRSLSLFHGSIVPFFERPLCLVLIALIVLTVGYPLYREFRGRKTADPTT
ncbi:C4-dicarboxylate ABC transporter permease [Synergistales bacterium]|nr:C4-dicarboxylate ABC transporter permease [Synergistales bacterium]